MTTGNTSSQMKLLMENKQSRLKAEGLYIYDFELFNKWLLKEQDLFDIFACNGINHTSCRYVIHYLTRELKSRLGEIDKNNVSRHELSALYDVFKPSLGQFNQDDIEFANRFIKSMFPYGGCSYTGPKLQKMLTESKWITIILSLRIVWSLLPEAIVPWDTFEKFAQWEKNEGFNNFQSFYQQLPIFMPSHNHCCVLFEFLEIFITIFDNDYLLDLKSALDVVYTAGQICFSRDTYCEGTSDHHKDDDLQELQNFYYKRGYSFHYIFVSYLRALSKESTFSQFAMLDIFDVVKTYPPADYKPVTQRALTLTVPSDEELKTTNYFKLISVAANSSARIYSSNHTFTKYENKFLDKFEVNPYKVIDNFFSKSSKNYLLKFDRNLNFDNFKVNSTITKMRKSLKDDTLFANKEFISTFIKDFNRYGFESERENGNSPETFLQDTINMNFSSSFDQLNSNPVRLSKLEISEWFINAWKYETFLGYLQNTAVIKLTRTIGDCDWLILTSHDKVSANNRYLTPPNSAGVEDQEANDISKQDRKPPRKEAHDIKQRSATPRASMVKSAQFVNGASQSDPLPKLILISNDTPQCTKVETPKRNNEDNCIKRASIVAKKSMENLASMVSSDSFSTKKEPTNVVTMNDTIDSILQKPMKPIERSSNNLSSPKRASVMTIEKVTDSIAERSFEKVKIVSVGEKVKMVSSSEDVSVVTSEKDKKAETIEEKEEDDTASQGLMTFEKPPAREQTSRYIYQTPPQLCSPTVPPPLIQSSLNVNSMDSVTSKFVTEKLNRNPSEIFGKFNLAQVSPQSVLESKFEGAYSQDKVPMIKTPVPPASKSITIELPSTAQCNELNVDNGSPRNHSSILNHRPSLKSRNTSGQSPVTQMLPKFFRKPSMTNDFSRSESNDSLSFINDGSGTDNISKTRNKTDSGKTTSGESFDTQARLVYHQGTSSRRKEFISRTTPLSSPLAQVDSPQLGLREPSLQSTKQRIGKSTESLDSAFSGKTDSSNQNNSSLDSFAEDDNDDATTDTQDTSLQETVTHDTKQLTSLDALTSEISDTLRFFDEPTSEVSIEDTQ